MKHARTSRRKQSFVKQPFIKIYTTAEIVAAFTARAEEQSRSISKHGEFLVKQDLALANRKQVA